jgi:hypothetical protein
MNPLQAKESLLHCLCLLSSLANCREHIRGDLIYRGTVKPPIDPKQGPSPAPNLNCHRCLEHGMHYLFLICR